MDADGPRALVEPFGPVTVKRMFGGHGLYSEALCFAIEHGGEVFLKVDAESQPSFAAAGSSPFI
jgi:DNA transformation protein and related proteins